MTATLLKHVAVKTTGPVHSEEMHYYEVTSVRALDMQAIQHYVVH